jgi:very-short-patch-repair endonuclease
VPEQTTGLCGTTHHIGGQLHKASGERDHALAAIASQQHGVVSHAQLLGLGITQRSIERRVGAGRLHRAHRGVYRVGHTAEAPLASEAAAVLACGPGTVLSHRSAGAIWGMVERTPAEVEVTVVGRDCGVKPGIRHRRVGRLASVDVGVRSQLPLTAPARTLLDLGSVLGQRALRQAVNEALVARLVTENGLRQVLERCRGRRGAPQLRCLLADGRGPALTRSEAERRLLDIVAARGVSVPETNVKVGHYEVDLLWRAERVVVEVDGYAFHSTRASFERDRLRDAELQARGFAVVRVTWRQIVETPAATVARIVRVLDARRFVELPTT